MSAAVPRLAASLLLLRDAPLRVLMVRRSPHGTFPGAMVFPGGTVDPDDGDAGWLPLLAGAEALDMEARALRVAALRECWEEVGIALADAPLRDAGLAFRPALVRAGARLPLDRLVPFGRWITPEAASRRWDTHFFLCAAPADVEPCCDEVETVAAEWVAPGTAAEAEAMLFPTRMNLKRLAESATVAEAIAAARIRPPFTVLPTLERRGDALVATIPAAAGYGVTEDPRPISLPGA